MARRRGRRRRAAPPERGSIRNRTLHLEKTLCYLNGIGLDHLDGVIGAITQRLSELGSAPRPEAHVVCEMPGSTSPSGNIGGILLFVKDARGIDDIATLQTLEAVISKRMDGAGYTPKPLNPKPLNA